MDRSTRSRHRGASSGFSRERRSTGSRNHSVAGSEQAGTFQGDQYFKNVDWRIDDPETANTDVPLVSVVATVKYEAATISIGGQHDMRVELVVDGDVVDDDEFVLEAGEERFAGGLAYEFPERLWGDGVPVAVRLFRTTRNEIQVDEATKTVQVWEPDGDGTGGNDGTGSGYLNPTITGTNSPVVAGDPISANVEIENGGSAYGSQTVEASIGGIGSDTSQVGLEVGGKTTESFTIPTAGAGAGTYQLSVSTDDASDTASVTIESPPDGGPDNEPSGSWWAGLSSNEKLVVGLGGAAVGYALISGGPSGGGRSGGGRFRR